MIARRNLAEQRPSTDMRGSVVCTELEASYKGLHTGVENNGRHVTKSTRMVELYQGVH